MSPSRPWDPALWSLRFGARWFERTKQFSKWAESYLIVVLCTLYFTGEKISIWGTIISCGYSVRKYKTKQCQVYAETLLMVYILYIYVAIKYPITFDHAGAVWCIPFSLPNIWRGDYMCIVHTEFILWFLISKTTFPDVECKTRSAGEGFVKVNKGGWDWWSCSQQEEPLLHGQEINKRVEILSLAFKNRKWPPVYSWSKFLLQIRFPSRFSQIPTWSASQGVNSSHHFPSQLDQFTNFEPSQIQNTLNYLASQCLS